MTANFNNMIKLTFENMQVDTRIGIGLWMHWFGIWYTVCMYLFVRIDSKCSIKHLAIFIALESDLIFVVHVGVLDCLQHPQHQTICFVI